jgi:cellulase/cellobiase CelA1
MNFDSDPEREIGEQVPKPRQLRWGMLGFALCLVAACNGNGSAEDSVTLEYAKGPLRQSGVIASLTIHDDWGTGFCGSVSVVNKGSIPVRNWQLVLQRNGVDFGRMWGGVHVESETRVIVSPGSADATIPLGATASVPFCGRGTGRPTLQSMTVDTGDDRD